MQRVASRVGGLTVTALRRMTGQEVGDAIANFPPRYVTDWDQWRRVDPRGRAKLFGMILRRWQATRPHPMRRSREERANQPPFLDDLLQEADGRVSRLGELSVESISTRSGDQESALVGLWHIFRDLTVAGEASSVGITKAVLLVTNGRIGPAFDSNVQRSVGVSRPTSARQWIALLEAVSNDIAAFEAANGPLRGFVPIADRHLAYGRIYDMIFGPGRGK
jgi:hypothetical protein